MELKDDEIRRITEYLDSTTPLPEHADLLFVFGSRWSTPAEVAIDIFRRSIVPHIVLTGGDNRFTGENEANFHRTLLLEAGIADDKIILENRSTNTLENVTFALPLIEQVVSLESLKTGWRWLHLVVNRIGWYG